MLTQTINTGILRCIGRHGTMHMKLAAVLLKNGADVNVQDYRGFSPLHWAAWNNAHETAIVLLENGANVDTQNEEGDTPPALGSMAQCYEAEALSLEDRTGVNPREKSGFTLLHWQHGVTLIKRHSC